MLSTSSPGLRIERGLLIPQLIPVEKSGNNCRRCLHGLSCMGGDLADLINMADRSEWKGHAKIFLKNM